MKYHSVTTVLSSYQDFAAIPVLILEAAAKRGTAVHDACAGYANGLFAGTLPLGMQSFFDSFKAWFDTYVDQVFFVEEAFTNHLLRYTGRVDLVCRLTDGRVVVVDYKTPVTEAPIWKGQLAAYRDMVIKRHPEWSDMGCMSLMLNRDGHPAKAITYEYSDDDFVAFCSALNAYRYFSD